MNNEFNINDFNKAITNESENVINPIENILNNEDKKIEERITPILDATKNIDISDINAEDTESDDDFESRIAAMSGEPKLVNIPNTKLDAPEDFVKVSNSEESMDYEEDRNTSLENDNDTVDEMSFDIEDPTDEETSSKKNNKPKRDVYYHSYADQNNKPSQELNNKTFLQNINVDLNNITITEKSNLKQIEDLNFVFEKSIPAFRVVCCQSGYAAALSGLTLSEKNAINNSNLDLFQSKQRLYKTVYNKIQSITITPKPSFDQWLKITTFGDLSTLLFGIYCQTFIDNNDFDITCGHCKKTTGVTIDNRSLIEVRDKEVYGRIDETIPSINTLEELEKISLLFKNERIMLNDSKIVLDICTPSLYDQLALIKKANPKLIEEYPDIFAAMLYIKHIYMLDARQTYDTGVAHYYEVKDKDRILNILLKLSNNDGEQLENSISNKLDKYRIDYEIHNVKCSHCGSELPNIPVDIETILFTRMNRTALD